MKSNMSSVFYLSACRAFAFGFRWLIRLRIRFLSDSEINPLANSVSL